MIAMSPEVFTAGLMHDWHEQAECFFSEARKQDVRLPSDRRHEARQRSEQNGVEVSDALLKELASLLPG